MAEDGRGAWPRSACRRRSGRSPGRAAKRLARYVLDIASLSRAGVCWISPPAPALSRSRPPKAGAASVEASEIDEFALAAIAMNAARNGAAVKLRARHLVGADEGWDVVLAGDVSYQRDMAEAVTAWLAGLCRRGATVLIGDPWRSYLASDLLDPVAEYSVPVDPRAGRLRLQAHGRVQVQLERSRPRPVIPYVRCLPGRRRDESLAAAMPFPIRSALDKLANAADRNGASAPRSDCRRAACWRRRRS